MTEYPLVRIEWVDSAQPISAWMWLKDEEWGGIVACQSVGWLIQDGDMKVLAQNCGETEGEWQVSGVIRIPSRSVVSVKKLTK